VTPAASPYVIVYDYPADGNFNQATAYGTLTILDKTPPVVLGVSASPNVLWPPNHAMVPIAVTVSVRDAATRDPICSIVSATRSEPDNGRGNGDTTNDVAFRGLIAVLRAGRTTSLPQ